MPLSSTKEFLNSPLNLVHSIWIATALLSALVWFYATFQKKDDAEEVKKGLQERITRIELEISSIRRDITDISRDTSYIRGRLEPSIKANK